MKRIQEKYGLLIIGIIIGIVYAVLTRIVFGDKATLASITYLFVIPTILGIIPLMFVDKDKLRAYKTFIFVPWLTLGCFFTTLYLFGIEDFLCVVILAAPFFILATIGSLIYVLFQINQEKKNNKLFSILIIPFLLGPIENMVKSPSKIYEVKSEVEINATPKKIWDNIVEVKTIDPKEYNMGIFNEMGIPRPLNAQVNWKGLGGQRIGNFENGLKFIEAITVYEENKKVSFNITVDNSSVADEIFERHVLNGNYFRFVDATYQLKQTNYGKVKLSLTTKYLLTSKINFYGKFWGDLMLKDFQDRLLAVIENRCENK
ncbi:hypothetical protein [Flavobacterium terrae]|uniref:Polyketide cyclase / dehydrase and lipid transport n=1 Tax=Flavobacterium terrae TaxID=415425 RepID=A0A1M6HGM5_9FLAO|nr:hypothetical protein [Flavobacterium terrae]SHJ21380.1 hypothetical protein SAMN05444363_0005 [Flavobacterium terrae]